MDRDFSRESTSMLVTLSIATAGLVAASILPFWSHPHWFVRGMDFPRPQFAVLAMVLLAAQLVLLDGRGAATWILISCTLVCLIWQLRQIAPYTPFWPVEVRQSGDPAPERRLRILSVNVLTPNRGVDRLLRLVERHEPDVLVTLESDRWWQDRLDVLEPDMPYTIKCPLDNLYGMHVYSRLPLEDAEISFLVEEDVPSIHALVRLRNEVSVRVHFLHPAPPSPTENPESKERDAELVIVARSIGASIGKSARELGNDQPVVVTGDLNDVAWSSTTRLFRRLSGLLDPRVGRGLFNTFHAKLPFLRWPLDHLFHSRHFTLTSIRRLPTIGSDHFPLLTELSYEPNAEPRESATKADAEDRSRARELASDLDVSQAEVPRPGVEEPRG